MSGPRLTPFSGRVAHSRLQGAIDAPTFTDGRMMRLRAPLVDLLRYPDGPRDRQLVRGARVCVIDHSDSMAYVQAETDGYCGWLPGKALCPDHPVTHRVSTPATHLYTAPDLKSPDLAALSLNARVQIIDLRDCFAQTDDGAWIPLQHLSQTAAPHPVAVAESLLGTPYLWGGNSHAGLDCSALVQLALHACDIPCPGDSDLQERALGPALPEGTPHRRGDLIFWRGHVAWVSAPDTILHANAHTMSVAYEPLSDAITRIASDSPVTSHLRPV